MAQEPDPEPSVELQMPAGLGTVVVAVSDEHPDRIDTYKAGGWTEVEAEAAKPKPKAAPAQHKSPAHKS